MLCLFDREHDVSPPFLGEGFSSPPPDGPPFREIVSGDEDMKIEELYRTVTASIIAELEQGAAPWVRPWTPGTPVMPENALTGRAYSGINVVILWMTAQARLYPTNRWLTFQQALEHGACVRKGEKSATVVFVKRVAAKEEEETKGYGVYKTFNVFNVAQVDGLTGSETTLDAPRRPVLPFVGATGAQVQHGHSQAFYSPGHDAICIPNPETFIGEEQYQATLLHELTHWTGHESRLNRDLKHRFGTKAYAAEELVAEMGAAFLCAHLGINGELRHAGYITSWLELLKEDDRAIFTASSKASQAADYLRSFSEAEALAA